MSENQKRASRLNGSRSRGPKTPEGKQRSSRNATKHGLLAQYVVVPGEDPAAFQSLVDSHIAKLGAADDTERDLIEEMAAANWRQRRLWAIEAALYKEATEAQPPGTHLTRLAAAFSTLADNGRLALLYRYETRLHLMYRRAYQNLVLMRNAPVPNEPENPFDSSESNGGPFDGQPVSGAPSEAPEANPDPHAGTASPDGVSHPPIVGSPAPSHHGSSACAVMIGADSIVLGHACLRQESRPIRISRMSSSAKGRGRICISP